MSEEAEGEAGEAGQEEGEPKKGGGKKLILMIVLPLLLLAGGGAGVYFSGLLDPLLGQAPEGEAAAEAEKVPEGPGHFFELDEMLVTLNSKGRRQSFLKMRISLELAKPEDELRIVAVMPRIVDNFQVFLRELRIEELQGSQGLYRVKEELLARVNAAAHPAKVRDVLFREMLVQ